MGCYKAAGAGRHSVAVLPVHGPAGDRRGYPFDCPSSLTIPTGSHAQFSDSTNSPDQPLQLMDPRARAGVRLDCRPPGAGDGGGTRGAGSPAAALAMVFKLVESARTRRRANTGAYLVPLVRAGARFENGQLVERTETLAA